MGDLNGVGFLAWGAWQNLHVPGRPLLSPPSSFFLRAWGSFLCPPPNPPPPFLHKALLECLCGTPVLHGGCELLHTCSVCLTLPLALLALEV